MTAQQPKMSGERRDITKRLFQAGSLTALTAATTLFVVVVSAAGTEVSAFRDYTLGYFLGTFATMVLYPQFSFYIFQYGSEDRDRLKMLFVSCVLASTLAITSIILASSSVASILGLGLLSGVILNTGIYLNTEFYALALREQALKSYFIVRIVSIALPFAIWGATTLLFGDPIGALLLFEIVRGVVFFVFFGLGFWALAKTQGFPTIGLPPGVFRIMAPRHVIKLCEAALIVLMPFLIMQASDGPVAAVRVGFQIGLTLTGIVGIVMVPRILRSERSTQYVNLYVHALTAALLLGAILLWFISNYDFGMPFLSFVLGGILAVFIPAISLSGALMLRNVGGGPVAGAWSCAVVLVLVMLVLSEQSMLLLVAGLCAVSTGYSFLVLFEARH